jgi:ATP-dependent DNA helicase RecG
VGEDHRLDYKSAKRQAKDFAKELSAFGNGPSHFGGVVVIGVEKDGTVSGCRGVGEAKVRELEAFGASGCEGGRFETKRMQCLNHKGEDDFIILARVYYVPERLVTLGNGEAYKRVSDESKRLDEEEKNEIRIAKGERAFEQETAGFSYPDDFHEDRVRDFCRRIRADEDIRPDITDEQILENKLLGHRIATGFAPSNALALLFARQPQRLFPGCYIRILRYEGIHEGTGRNFNVIKDRTIEGTVIDQIKDAASFISANLREFTHFNKGKFETRPEYPTDAWYELLGSGLTTRT